MKSNNLQNSIKLPSEKSFGIIFSIIFFLLYFFIFKNLYIKYIFLSLSFIFVVTSFIKPSLLKYLNKIWFRFGILLGNIISPIIMGLIFILVFLPISILLKIFKNDFMGVKINRNINTYWKTKSIENNSMKNQF